MAWSRLQSKNAVAASGSSLGVAYGSALTSGSKLIALVQADGVTTSTVKDGAGNSFTKLAFVTGTNTADLSLWGIDCPAGDAGGTPTITATFSGASNGCAILIQEVSGLLAGNTTAMLDGTAGTSTAPASSATTNPTYSSTALNEYLVACYGDDGLTAALTWTAPGGYTADANAVNSSTDANCAISYKNSTNGSESGNYSESPVVNDKQEILVAFKLAAGGGPPAYPFATLVRRQAWPRQFVRRGRVFTPVPPQVNPPYPWAEITQRRQTWPRGLPRRGRVYTPVPPQVNPPYPWAEIRQWRQPRGFFPRRGHQFTPVPPQQAAAPNPPMVFQNVRHQRVLYVRRGRMVTPVPPQDAPLPEVAQRRQAWPRGLPRRGRQFAPVPGQDAPLPEVAQRRQTWPRGLPRRGRVFTPVAPQVNPPIIVPHRTPPRAIALIRRRFRQLIPWPQVTAPVAQQGTVAVTIAPAATVAIVNQPAGNVAIANTPAGAVAIVNTPAGSVAISNNPAGTVTIVNEI